MIISRTIFATLLLCIFAIGFVYSQEENKSKNVKPKDTNAASILVEVKANLVVLNADNKYVNDVKLEDLKIYEDGNEQRITRFVKKQNALSVGFVMDNTGSMKNQFGKMEAAAAEFVKNLRPQDEAFVVRFVDSDTVEVTQDWTADKAALKDALANMYIEGGKSAVIDALYLSAEKMLAREQADLSKRCALILFSDGDERDSYYEAKELFALLKGSDVQIFGVGLTQDLSDKKNEYTKKKNSKTNAENLINRLALQTGGAAFFPVFTATLPDCQKRGNGSSD